MSPSFIHLRVHSEYSLVDGLVKVKSLIKAVGEAGMPAVAITDQNNMCSLVKFYKTATGAGIKPISGVDLWLTDAEDDSVLTRISLLAMDPKGYRNLTELVSRGFTEGQRNGLVTVRREWVAEASEGVIALSAAKEGEVGLALLSSSPERADELLAIYDLAGAEIVEIEINWAERTGRLLTHPVVTSILLSVAIFGLIAEVRTPGWGLGGSLALMALATGTRLALGIQALGGAGLTLGLRMLSGAACRR